MSGNGHADARAIRDRLNHPIIDADGHWLEFGVLGLDQMRRIGGDRAAEGFASARQRIRDSLSMSVADRRRRWVAQEAFWAFPSKNTVDRATAMFPGLLYERLPELGIDFAMLYPTAGLSLPRLPDPKV